MKWRERGSKTKLSHAAENTEIASSLKMASHAVLSREGHEERARALSIIVRKKTVSSLFLHLYVVLSLLQSKLLVHL